MDQGVISDFKTYLMRRTFTVRNFWKNFSIIDTVKNIAESWDEAKSSTSNSRWKSIWPDCICDISSFPKAGLHQIWKDIVTLANDGGFEEVIVDDVVELLVSYRESILNEELILFEQEEAEDADDKMEIPSTQIDCKEYN